MPGYKACMRTTSTPVHTLTRPLGMGPLLRADASRSHQHCRQRPGSGIGPMHLSIASVFQPRTMLSHASRPSARYG